MSSTQTAKIPANAALRTDYHSHYVRLGGDSRRRTSFDPLGPGLATGDGKPGGMIDSGHAGGGPSRREAEIAAWLTASVSPELEGAQFDIATLLAKVEQMRDALWMARRNMIEAESRAAEAESGGALGELGERFALLHLSAVNLARQNETLRAALDLCEREHGHAPGEIGDV